MILTRDQFVQQNLKEDSYAIREAKKAISEYKDRITKEGESTYLYWVSGYYLEGQNLQEGINKANRIMAVLNSWGYYTCLDWEEDWNVYTDTSFPLCIQISINPIQNEPDIYQALHRLKYGSMDTPEFKWVIGGIIGGILLLLLVNIIALLVTQ